MDPFLKKQNFKKEKEEKRTYETILFSGKLRLGSVPTKYKGKKWTGASLKLSSNAWEWLRVISSKEDVGRHYTPRELHQHMSYLAILQA
jgi:hypothetical protein